MEKPSDNSGNARYNDEILFIDGILDLHPEIFTALSSEDQKLMQTYYLVGQPVPDNIFVYRQHLVREQPELQPKAEVAFQNLLKALGVSNFNYTTKPPKITK